MAELYSLLIQNRYSFSQAEVGRTRWSKRGMKRMIVMQIPIKVIIRDAKQALPKPVDSFALISLEWTRNATGGVRDAAATSASWERLKPSKTIRPTNTLSAVIISPEKKTVV
ncbi:MAG: hypothetical protein MI685_05150 [Chlorobiales bacterium]|nr:hypothetical protein [Chlorobiales bacterium]